MYKCIFAGLLLFATVLFNAVCADTRSTVLIRNLPDRPGQLHPHHFGGSPEARILKDAYEGLMVQNRNGEPVPGMAADVDISADRMTYRFTLREGISWSDGSPVTADDFVRSFHTLADPATRATYRWYLRVGNFLGADKALGGSPGELGVKADNNQLVINLEQPVPYILELLTFPSFLPVAASHNPERPVSNGPYQIISQQSGEEIKLRRNPYYYRSDEVMIREVTYRFRGDEEQELDDYRQGRVTISARLSAANQLQARNAGLVRLMESQILATSMILLNKAHAALANSDFRQALSLALDRTTLVQSNYPEARVRPACSLTAPLTRGFSPDAKNCQQLLHNTEHAEEARKLLTRSGVLPDQHTLTITSTTKYDTDRLLKQMIAQWHSVLGIKVNVRTLPWQEFVAAMAAKDYDLMFFSWLAGYNDTTAFLLPIMQEPGFGPFDDNREYRELLEKAASRSTMMARLTYYEQAEAVLARELPVIPVLHPTSVHLVQPVVEGYYTSNPEGWVHTRYLRLLR